MDLKEIEARIRAEYPDFSKIVDQWPATEPYERRVKDLVWKLICTAYDYGFTEGMTHGLEQHAKIMNFAMGKILGKQAGR